MAALASLAGCSSPLTVFPAPTTPIAGSDIRARDLLARLDARYAALRSFRALADMDYTAPRERLHVREVVVIERPDRLRIEMMSAFGVALQITSDGEQLRAYHRGERTFYSGAATARNLARFTRLELALRDITDLLVGLPPGRKRRGPAQIAFEEETDLWRVTTPLAGRGTQIVWFDHDRLLPVRTEEVDEEGNRNYLTSYGDYREVEGFIVPHEVMLEIPAQQASVVLRYADVALNEALAKTLFSFDPPPGAKTVDLDSAG